MAEKPAVIQPLRKRASTEKMEHMDKPEDSLLIQISGVSGISGIAMVLSNIADGLKRQNELMEEQNKLMRDQSISMELSNKISLAPTRPVRDENGNIKFAYKDISSGKDKKNGDSL